MFHGRFTRSVVAAILALSTSGLLKAASSYAAEALPKDPVARAEALSAQAEKAFSDGQFEDAIRLYLDAWEAMPSAAILYNVGFIYEKRLNESELALEYYRKVASSADVEEATLTKARARIAAIETSMAKPQEPGGTAKEPVIGKVTEEPVEIEPDSSPEAPAEVGKTNLLPWIVAGAGGAILLGGIATGFVALGTHEDFEAARDAADKNALQSTGQTEALVADVLMGTGIAVAVGGLVWALLDQDPPSNRADAGPVTRFKMSPWVFESGAGLALGGSL